MTKKNFFPNSPTLSKAPLLKWAGELSSNILEYDRFAGGQLDFDFRFADT
jgi:hypothetical protein